MIKHTPPGLILLDKQPNISSYRALGAIKAIIGRKVGHCGTLDPFASGLLIVVSGALTKIAAYFQSLPKTYRAEIYFGRTTDTLDVEGDVISQGADVPDENALRQAITAMHGRQLQVPPQYSALKVNGERAYKNARRGKFSELAARPIEIYDFSLIQYHPPKATVVLTVSAGTYIRAVARDLASRCSSIAHLSALRRVRIGEVTVDDACCATEFRKEMLISPHDITALNARCRVCFVPEHVARRVAHGEPLAQIEYFNQPDFSLTSDQCALIFNTTPPAPVQHETRSDASTTSSHIHTLLAICAYRDKQLRYLHVCPNV